MKYYSEDEIEYENDEVVENNSETYNVYYMDINHVFDIFDEVIKDYSTSEYTLANIGYSDFLYPSIHKFKNDNVIIKRNNIIYEMSNVLFSIIEYYIRYLSEEDQMIFKNINVNIIYSRIMKNINFRFVNLQF